jgi:SAM-dependent methyltransferase
LDFLEKRRKEEIKKLLERGHAGALLELWRYVRDKYHNSRPAAAVFSQIYRRNDWGGTESVSGPGSSLSRTNVARKAIAELITSRNIKTILDAPCGDFHWMRLLDLGQVDYCGVDIVSELIAQNIAQHSRSNVTFQVLDIVKDPLPQVDLIVCRDALVHLFYKDIFQALRNFKSSGSTYLLTTSFPGHENRDIRLQGDWRPFNLQSEPINLKAPRELFNEECDEMDGIFKDKSLVLWSLDDLDL